MFAAGFPIDSEGFEAGADFRPLLAVLFRDAQAERAVGESDAEALP